MASILAILTVFIALPLNWYVVFKLWRLSHAEPHIRFLRERGVAATVVAVIVTVLGLIFLNNDMAVAARPLDTDATKLITRGVVLALSVASALYWIWLFRRSKL